MTKSEHDTWYSRLLLMREIDVTVPDSVERCRQKLEAWCRQRNAICKVEVTGARDVYAFSVRYDPHIPRSSLEIEASGTIRRVNDQETQVRWEGKLAKATYVSVGWLLMIFGVFGVLLPIVMHTTMLAVVVIVLIVAYLVILFSDYRSQFNNFMDSLRNAFI